jgi:hypothetical protein
MIRVVEEAWICLLALSIEKDNMVLCRLALLVLARMFLIVEFIRAQSTNFGIYTNEQLD